MDQDFLNEAEELVEQLSQGLMQYEKAINARQKINPEILNDIFRAAHTFKGIAGVFGYRDIGTLVHALETLLDLIRKNQIQVSKTTLDLLFETVDMLENLLRQEASPSKLNILVSQLQSAAQENTAGTDYSALMAELQIAPNMQQSMTDYEEARLAANVKDNKSIVLIKANFTVDNFDVLLPKVKNWLKKHGELIATLPFGEQSDEQKMVFQFIFATSVNLDKFGKYLQDKGYGFKILKRSS